MTRERITSWPLGGGFTPGMPIKLSGTSAGDCVVVFLRQIDNSTIEVLPVPLTVGHGLLIAVYWMRYQALYLWRWARR
jgi:hypothetical protein